MNIFRQEVRKLYRHAKRHVKERRFREAAKVYQSILSLDPLEDKAYHLRGVLLARMPGVESQAEECLLNACYMAPNNARYLLDLVGFYFSKGQVKQALEWLYRKKAAFQAVGATREKIAA